MLNTPHKLTYIYFKNKYLYVIQIYDNVVIIKFEGGQNMAKVKGTNRRTRQKRSYTKPGSKRGRGVKQTWKK